MRTFGRFKGADFGGATSGSRALRRTRLICALLLFGIASTFVSVVSTSAPASASACGTLLIRGSDWLGGQGVDVLSNGNGSCSGGSAGYGYQCVDLAYRLYQARGWGRVYAAGNGCANFIPEGSPNLEFHPNGSGYTPVPGDLIIHDRCHVSVVDSVVGGTINAVEQNTQWNGVDHPRRSYTFGGGGNIGDGGHSHVRGTMHSASNRNVNASAPGVPSFTAASASTSGTPKITLSWNTPNNNGAGIQWYDIEEQGGSYCGVIRANSVTFPPGNCGSGGGFTPQLGKTYRFRVRAYNGVGSSCGVNGVSCFSDWSQPLTPVATPGAPTSVTATPSNGAAQVSWLAPTNNGGVPITGYVVTSNPGSKTCSAAASPCVVTGLTNGTAYTFTVVASNAPSSSSAPSAPSTAVTPTGAPTSPAATRVTAGDSSVVVAWDPPVSNNGSPVLSYRVTSTPDAKTCSYQVTVPATEPVNQCMVNGLRNGTSYTFAVVATNGLGDSTAATSVAVTPARVPDAPTAVTAIPGKKSAVVSWTAPADGGAAITQYTVVSAPEGLTCTSTATSCTVSGLHTGLSYTFTVRATNIVGSGAASTASDPVVIGTPSAPAGVSTMGRPQSVTVWWQAAAGNGYYVTGYTATASPGGRTCTSTGLSCTITGLTDGTAYTITVVAKNAKGSSPASATSAEVKPINVPGAPVAVVGASADRSVKVSWTAPTVGGDTVDAYLVTASPGGSTCWWSQGPLECVVPGLDNGSKYTFSVIAFNEIGESISSKASSQVLVGLPGSPSDVSGYARNASVVVSWKAPLSGATVDSYLVTSTPGSKTCTVAAPALTCTVSGLTNGVAYTFTVKSVNTTGNSANSAASSAVTPQNVPPAVTNVTAVAGLQNATVSWTPPQGVAAPITYTVTSSPEAKSCSVVDGTSCSVTGLAFGTSYTFTVVATNASGAGATSAASNAITPMAVPSAPASLQAQGGDGSAVLTWTAATANGTPVTGYVITGAPGGTCSPSPATALTCTVTGLTNGTSYTFSVVATSAIGSSTAKSASPVVPSGAPSVPTNLRQTDRSTTAVWMNWNESANNGSPIDTYVVQLVGTDKSCSAGPGAGTCVVGGLPSGSCFQVSIRAHNANGWGITSGAVQACTAAAPAVYHARTVKDGLYQYPGPNFLQPGWNTGPRGTVLDIVCQVYSSAASNNNRWWHKLTNGHYIPDDYTDTPSIGPGNGIPQC